MFQDHPVKYRNTYDGLCPEPLDANKDAIKGCSWMKNDGSSSQDQAQGEGLSQDMKKGDPAQEDILLPRK
jgi:hypothetical protein